MNNNSASTSYNNPPPAIGALISLQEKFIICDFLNTIGIKEDGDVYINDQSISRRLAYIKKRATDEFLIRCMSSSKTYLNGRKVERFREYTLNHKDTIAFSDPARCYQFFIYKNMCRAEIEELKGQHQEESRFTKQKLEKILREKNELIKEKIEAEKKLEISQKEKEELKEKLEQKEKELKIHQKAIEGLHEHLSCIICTELLVEATILNCGHTFCKSCIKNWKKENNACPNCRTKISEPIPAYVIDSLTDNTMFLPSTEAKKRRKELLKSRKDAQTPLNCSKKKNWNQTPVAAISPILPARERSATYTPERRGRQAVRYRGEALQVRLRTLQRAGQSLVVWETVVDGGAATRFTSNQNVCNFILHPRRQVPSTVTRPIVEIDDRTPESALPNGTTNGFSTP